MALNKNVEATLKTYYSIKEVAAMFNVSETLLRFWEKEFPNISPEKGGRGIRSYKKEDIEQIRLVYHLVKERGMTLQGARDVIKHNKGVTNQKIAVIEKLKKVSAELQALNKELNNLV
jgi:DNA-binding transcriptional MerR regulator